MKKVETFEINIEGEKIVLRGELNGSRYVRLSFLEALGRLPHHARFIVEAQEALVTPEGVMSWIENAVGRFLMPQELVYAPSQLSLILQYDPRYPHRNSEFQEYIKTTT